MAVSDKDFEMKPIQLRLFNSLEQLHIQSAQDEFVERRLSLRSSTSSAHMKHSERKARNNEKRHTQTMIGRYILVTQKKKNGTEFI